MFDFVSGVFEALPTLVKNAVIKAAIVAKEFGSESTFIAEAIATGDDNALKQATGRAQGRANRAISKLKLDPVELRVNFGNLTKPGALTKSFKKELGFLETELNEIVNRAGRAPTPEFTKMLKENKEREDQAKRDGIVENRMATALAAGPDVGSRFTGAGFRFQARQALNIDPVKQTADNTAEMVKQNEEIKQRLADIAQALAASPVANLTVNESGG